ncbi:MAG: NVEALA domain-containing protein [Tannerella sp.]|jgi:hypothetical protein|nr:NVEALA domain-containing protein [Tannerella sp.]
MNKKFFFGSIAVLAIAALTAFNVNVNSQEDGLSDVSLDNIEALAQESGRVTCFQETSGRFTCAPFWAGYYCPCWV